MHLVRAFVGLAAGICAVSALARGEMHEAGKAPQGAAKTSPYRNTGHSDSAALVTALSWGVDHLEVRDTSSGALIRFSYRVVDAAKAKVLHEKKSEPHLIGLRSHAMLSVPTLENVGQLRQTEAIENGKDYWVLFSNKGGLVKVGDRVDVLIGDFYVSGLTVE